MGPVVPPTGVLLLLPCCGSRGHPLQPESHTMKLMDLRVVLNEHHTHDGKTLVVKTPNGTHHTVTGVAVDPDTNTVTIIVEEETE